MRMMPSKYAAKAAPVQVKKGNAAATTHLTAPIKGLNLSSKLSQGDPLQATLLDNWVIDEDKIRVRPGRKLVYSHPDAKPIECQVPFYGAPTQNLALATNGKLTTMGGVTLGAAFTSNDWSWSSYANLGMQTYTVMVNGRDGVWSWDGGNTPGATPGVVTVTNLKKANPAVCTVAAADISKFHNGDYVTIAGGLGTGMINANGTHIISSVNNPVNTFVLIGVDTSAATADQTTGVTAQPAMTGSLVKETVLAPASTSFMDPNRLSIIMAHQNCLWFADDANLTAYYLPLQAKSGQLKMLPLNAMFRRGGSIRAIYSWTVDGGNGMDDKLCVFSSNGECAIYSGTNPDTDYQLDGVYRFDAPLNKNCVQQYGGELYLLISTGLVPMSTLMRAETEQLGQTDRSVFSAFMDASRRFRAAAGWQLLLDPSTSRMICNLPQGGANHYGQMVRFMPNSFWTSWSAVPARSWGWLNNLLYVGDDKGNLFAYNRSYLDDAGQAIKVDVQFAWSNYRSAGVKQFKMLKPYIITDGRPRPMIDMQVDYDVAPPANQPDLSFGSQGADWDTADWNTADWAAGVTMTARFSGVGRLGVVGAPRLSAQISGCDFALAGIDVLYETGSVMG
jgi:hypothetical protein